MRNKFAEHLHEKLDTNLGKRTCLITGDLGYSVLEPLREKMGARFINAGVAEALMTSLAAGLADEGYRVYTYSITPFATFRCLEQIRNDVCYHNLDVTIVGVGAGYGYGALGATHHSLADFAALTSLPNLTVFNPGDLNEAMACYDCGWDIVTPKYYRIGKGRDPDLGLGTQTISENQKIIEYQSGAGVTIISTGTVIADLLPAVKEIGHDVQVLSIPWVKPFPTEELANKVTGHRLGVIEELTPWSGISGTVARTLLQTGRAFERYSVLTAPDQFAHSVGDAAHQRAKAGLDKASIKVWLKDLFH